jgi:hypothetical protein
MIDKAKVSLARCEHVGAVAEEFRLACDMTILSDG